MKTLKTTLALTAVFSMICPFLSAQEANANKKEYFAVGSQSVTLTSIEPGTASVPPQLPQLNLAGINKGAGGGLVNAGATAWGVITSGAPSGSYATAYASAIPGFSFNWVNVSGWKGPKQMVYHTVVTNLMGIDVIDVKYKISFFYDGTEDYSGKSTRLDNYVAQATGGTGTKEEAKVQGRYITNFTVQPVSINIKWGWKYDLSVKMSDPMNIGTKMSPVSYLEASLNWIQSTPFSTTGGTITYGVDGLGNFKDLNEQAKSVRTAIPEMEPVAAPAISWN
jgi:hypothetical protein